MISLGEVLRRIYREIVIGRSRVRVVAAQPPAENRAPVFLVGPYRSGTTLLRYVFDTHSSFACPPETDFLAVVEPLVQDHRYSANLDAIGFDRAHVLDRVRGFVSYFMENYARSASKPRWADKSPSYVDYLDFVRELYPEAQFVIIHRDPLQVIHSNTKGGTVMRGHIEPFVRLGEDPRLGAARYWVDKAQRLVSFVEENPNQCIQINYERLCEAPEAVLRNVFEFVGEEWEERVLQFYEYPHDLGLEGGRAIATRGFEASVDGYWDWPTSAIRDCLDIVAPAMLKAGYDPEARRKRLEELS